MCKSSVYFGAPPLSASALHLVCSGDGTDIAEASFGPIATVAAVLLLFCLITSQTQKTFLLPLST